MHIGSDTVGAELFADTMYVGKLKGVGTIWQYTLVDGACSFGFGRVRAGRKSAKSMAQFLEEDVLPVYREAKIKLRPAENESLTRSLRMMPTHTIPSCDQTAEPSGLLGRFHFTSSAISGSAS